MYIPHTRCVIATTVLILAVGVVVASGEGLRAPSLATGFTGAQIYHTFGLPPEDKCYKYLEKIHDRLTHVYASKACKGKGEYYKLFKLSPKCKRRIQYSCWRLNKFLRKKFKSCPKAKHMESEDKYLKSNMWFRVHPYCKGVGLENPLNLKKK